MPQRLASTGFCINTSAVEFLFDWLRVNTNAEKSRFDCSWINIYAVNSHRNFSYININVVQSFQKLGEVGFRCLQKKVPPTDSSVGVMPTPSPFCQC